MVKEKAVIEQVDRLFFRSNTPFDRFAKTWEVVPGQFPPSAFTLVGAFRAAMARILGWSGNGRWSDEIAALIGEDILDPSPLEFWGPFIEEKGKEGEPITYVPLPQFVVKQDERYALLRPDEGTRMKISGTEDWVHPLKTDQSFNTIKDGYIPLDKLKDLLTLKSAPESIKKGSEFYVSEFQPGVNLELGSKSSSDNRGFFTRQYIRFRDGVSIALYFQGSSGLPKSDVVTPLGGEGKFSVVRRLNDQEIKLPKITEMNRDERGIRFFVYFLTHYLPFKGEKYNQKRQGFLNQLKEDIGIEPSQFIGSAVGKSIRIGGWDMLRSRPLALDSYVPAGSVFFFRADDSQEQELLASSKNKIGQYTEFGFGHYLIGTW